MRDSTGNIGQHFKYIFNKYIKFTIFKEMWLRQVLENPKAILDTNIFKIIKTK